MVWTETLINKRTKKIMDYQIRSFAPVPRAGHHQ